MTIYFWLFIVFHFQLIVFIPFQLFIDISAPLVSLIPILGKPQRVNELVYIYKDGVWVKCFYHEQQNNVVGEIILNYVWFNPSPFEFSSVNFFGF